MIFRRRAILSKLALASVVVASLGGCRKPTASAGDATKADASVDAPLAKEIERPWSGVLVARSLPAELDAERVDDDGLIVRSGLYLYRATESARAETEIQRIGAIRDYDPFLWPEDQELAGYESRGVYDQTARLSGSGQRPFLLWNERARGWDGQAWKSVSPKDVPKPNHRRRWGSQDDLSEPTRKELPTTHWWSAHMRTKLGLVVWLGERMGGHGEAAVAIARADGDAGAKARIVPLDRSADGGGAPPLGRCDFVESSDSETYIYCHSYRGAGGGESGSLQEVEGDRLVEAFPSLDLGKLSVASHNLPAVDGEGALWVWKRGTDDQALELRRITKDGTEQTFGLPAPALDLTAPSFHASELETVAKGMDSTRVWIHTQLVADAPPGPPTGALQILPRAHDVWVTAHESGHALLYRFARGATSKGAMLLHTTADQQNEVRNARGLRRWTGHCATVFVPFPASALGADGGVDAYWTARKAAIDEAVSKMNDPKKGRADVAIIEGRFEGRPVAGVLFVRALPEVSEASMEAAASKVSQIVTAGPASPPETTCSVPSVARIVFQYEKLRGEAEYE